MLALGSDASLLFMRDLEYICETSIGTPAVGSVIARLYIPSRHQGADINTRPAYEGYSARYWWIASE